jgi:uncharacterized protein (DUF362 family)
MALSRRALLRAGAAVPFLAASSLRAQAAPYRVGVGRDPHPHEATVRAIEASGEWPSARVAGNTVIVKPNIVVSATPESGTITHPEVVRAVVERALQDGAREIVIVEASPRGALYGEVGYRYLADLDPRVRLIDLQQQAVTLAPLPGALAYPAVFIAEMLLRPDVVFVSVAKLKTHGDAIATLSMKNLFGLPAVDRYIGTPPYGRFAMHDRGVPLTIVDLNRLRPVDFAVIDGMWGMEGFGPTQGTPVQLDTVLAGRNALAVDRVGLAAMEIPQDAVQHLTYAARAGLGPATADDIVTAGDPLVSKKFSRPPGPPVVEYPRILPTYFRPGAGERCHAVMWYGHQCVRQVEVRRLYHHSTQTDVIAVLRPYAGRPTGHEIVSWDGRDQGGAVVPPGRYAVHVRAYHVTLTGRPADAIGWAAAVA